MYCKFQIYFSVISDNVEQLTKIVIEVSGNAAHKVVPICYAHFHLW